MDDLFERMGGFDGVDALAEDFAIRMAEDREMQSGFLSDNQGNDSGAQMKRLGAALLLGASSNDDIWVRRELVANVQFSNMQLDRMTQHLVDVLYSHDLSNRDIAQVIDYTQLENGTTLFEGDKSVSQRKQYSSRSSNNPFY